MFDLNLDTTVTYYTSNDFERSYFGHRPPTHNLLNILDEKYSHNTSIDNLEDKEPSFFKLLDNSVLDSSLLIPGLRFSAPGIVVFERPPTKKLVQYANYTVDEMTSDCDCEDCETSDYDIKIDQYFVPIPWQIYIATYSLHPNSKYEVTSIRMFFSNTSLNSPDTVLYAPYIHNFFMNASLCNPMFATYDEISRYPSNLQGVVASAYEFIWNTGFNRDLSECIDQTVNNCRYKDNAIISSYFKNISSNPHYSFVTNPFYYHLSKYEPEDVVSQTWANPSFRTHFSADREYFLQECRKYVNDNPHLIDSLQSNEYDEDDDDDEDDYYGSDEDNQTDPITLAPMFEYYSRPHDRVKTYSEIIDYIYNGDPYDQHTPGHLKYLTQFSDSSVSNFNSFVSSLRSLSF